MIYNFGSGVLFGKPTVGDVAALITPMQFGTLQEVQLEVSGDVKELFGRYQMPVDVARGKVKITGKAKVASIDGKIVNDLFFGQTVAAGQNLIILDEAQTIPASVSYVVTVSGSANFTEDLGVRYSATGLRFTRVTAGSEAVGKYSVVESGGGKGVYTFAVADAGVAVLISYGKTSTGGTNINVKNQLMGYGPKFEARLYNQYNAKQTGVKLWQCISTKFSFPTKIDDYVISDYEFSAMSDAAGNIIDIDSPE